MANENTLGAPTEGLGQTVTFGFKNTPRPGSQGVQRGDVRGGVQGSSGGGMAQMQRVQVKESPVVEMLMRVGQGIFDAKVKEARTGAFVTGMQRAMEGEAVADIAAEQPAWSRIFGDSDAAEGARAYSSERKVHEVMLGFEQNMTELRKMSPDQANAFYIKAVNASLTGDGKSDFAIMSAVQRNLPAVMKHQSQQHYAYMQEEAATQESAAIHASAARLQEAGNRLADNTLSQDDYDTQVANHGLLVTPPMGRDLKHWQDRRAGDIVLLAEQGNFHALNAMENVGVIDALTPQQKAAYTRSRQTNEFQYRSVYGAKYVPQLRQIRAAMADPKSGWTADMTVQAMAEVNDLHKKSTGSRMDFFNAEAMTLGGEATRNSIDNALKAQANELERRRQKALDAGEKEMAAQFERANISQHLALGSIPTLLGTGKTTEDAVNRQFFPMAISAVNNALSPKADFTQIVNTAIGGWFSKPLQAQLNNAVFNSTAGGAMTPSFAATYEAWRKMHIASDGIASAGYYKDHAKFLKFHMAHPGAIDVANPSPHLISAFLGSFGPDANSRGKLDKKEVAGILAGVAKEVNPIGWLPEYSGGPRGLRPGMAEFLANNIQGIAEVMHVTHSPADAIKAAMQVAPQHGMNIIGGYVWQDKGHPPFLHEMQKRIGPDRFMLPSAGDTAAAFSDIMDKAIEDHGGLGKESKLSMYRGSDDTLIATWSIEGQPRHVRFTYDALAEQLMNRFKKSSAKSSFLSGLNLPSASTLFPGSMDNQRTMGPFGVPNK